MPFNRTKILATVGPASNTPEKLWELVQAGADVFRLNFSHGSHEDHLKVINHIKALNAKYGTSIAMLQDLQGPKIRTGEVENNGVELKNGAKLIITTEKVIGNAERIYTSYTLMPRDVSPGDRILIDDGNLEIKVISTNGTDTIVTEVVYGGLLKSKKGINLPNTKVSEPSLTAKDKEDLLFGLEHGVDWVALSFVRNAKDIDDIKEIIKSKGKNTKVVAKIEKPEALLEIDAIIEKSDALMVARGDLGVEIPMEDVPLAQKMMIKKCNAAAKPVIVATQMLESMIKNPRPTRAEAGDVANAVIDGADAVMLSAESASGSFPIESVKAMVAIIGAIEKGTNVYNKEYELDKKSPDFLRERLLAGACRLADDINAKAIVNISKTGFVGNMISSHRPKALIFTFTDNKDLVNVLNLSWGIKPFYLDAKFKSTDEMLEMVNKILVDKKLVKKGDLILNTASMPIDGEFRTNMLKMSII
ncbi:MAG: pyruvate kinase [Bacteroidetes bacterium]|nr:MAG: pyruvate kinase [Bacteroidota bacterium]